MSGEHDSEGKLAPEVVDVIHLVITDPGRLTQSFVERLFEGAVDDVSTED